METFELNATYPRNRVELYYANSVGVSFIKYVYIKNINYIFIYLKTKK